MTFLHRDVRVEQLGDVTWRLLAAIAYLGKYGSYVVPPGYVTDFASVPRWLWWLVPQSGRYNAAAIVHDWLITDLLVARGITSPHVDAEFRGAMKELGVSLVQRWVMWAGVRWAAVLNPVRRPGWLTTLPLLLLVSAAVLAPFASLLLLFL